MSTAKNDPALSVRIPAADLHALKELAHHKRTTVTELVKASLRGKFKQGHELLGGGK